MATSPKASAAMPPDPNPTLQDAANAVAKAVDVVRSKPWHQSLTVQGAIVTGFAGAVVTYGPALLSALGLSPDAASAFAHDVSGLFSDVGALMVLIGRFRLGDLK